MGKLLEAGAIEEVSFETDQFISSIFVVPKPNGTYRLILNLKKQNTFIVNEHFKIEDFRNVCNLIQKDMFLATIDIKDAYYFIPVAHEDRKYLKFRWKGKLFQFTCLPFGLSTAPRIFTKVLKVVAKYLRVQGVICSIYLDDWLILAHNNNQCAKSVKLTLDLLCSLGFVISEKSKLTPSKKVDYLGFQFDSHNMIMSLSDKKNVRNYFAL